MKKHGMYPIGQMALICILSAGWWGLLYPEFGVCGDTLTVAEATKEPGKTDETGKAEVTDRADAADKVEAFWGLLGADSEDITIKSKLLETFFDNRGKNNEQQCTNRDF